MRSAAGSAVVALTLASCVCSRSSTPTTESEPPTPLPPPPVVEPEVGARYQLDYRGALRLRPDPNQGTVLETSATLVVTPREKPLERLALSPGLYDSGVRPEFGYAEWDWPLSALTSDRPIHVEVDAWKLTVIAAEPVPAGESWTIGFELRSGVAQLEPFLDAETVLASRPRSAGPATDDLLALIDLVFQHFGQAAATTSFAQDDFHVLTPPWPLPYDCAGKPLDEAFPPLDCIASAAFDAQVEVQLPKSWDMVLPTEPAPRERPGGDTHAVVTRLPSLFVASPTLARRELEVDGVPVDLCGPANRSAELEQLAQRIRDDLPALVTRLGPYPFDRLSACLSPLPFDTGGLASGRLALISTSVLGAVLPDDAATTSPVERLNEWLEQSAFLRVEREYTVLHELAHHWWITELPTRWSMLLAEGAASFIGYALLRERHQDPELRYFIDTHPWVDAAQIERAGIPLPPLSDYLRHRGSAWSPTERLMPYVHGLELFERMLEGAGIRRWVLLRAIHGDRQALAIGPDGVLAGAPEARRALAAILERDQRLTAASRIDLVDHGWRQMGALLEEELDRLDIPPSLIKSQMNSPTAREQRAEMYARIHGIEAMSWFAEGTVLALLEVESCIDLPEDEAHAVECRDALEADGPIALAAAMELADLQQWITVDRDPQAYADLFAPRGHDEIAALAEETRARPIRVTAEEMGALAEHGTQSEAVANLLFSRIHARWAADAYGELFGAAR